MKKIHTYLLYKRKNKNDENRKKMHDTKFCECQYIYDEFRFRRILCMMGVVQQQRIFINQSVCVRIHYSIL